MSPGTPTLDQLMILKCVVESGGFGAAARRLNRSVSVVSYGIAQLEAQIGLELFNREGVRQPTLTPAGRAILTESKAVLEKIDSLKNTARGLLQGLEAELSVAVDVMFPMDVLGSALREFAQRYPTVALRLHVEALGAVNALVIDDKASLGVSGPLALDAGGLETKPIGQTLMVPVAAPDHPLAGLSVVSSDQAKEHIQLVLTDRSTYTQGRDFSVLSTRTWRIADLGSKHALLCQGVGWGNMPISHIEADLNSGSLVRLNLLEPTGGVYRFWGAWRRGDRPGPAASWLLDRLTDLCAETQPPKGREREL